MARFLTGDDKDDPWLGLLSGDDGDDPWLVVNDYRSNVTTHQPLQIHDDDHSTPTFRVCAFLWSQRWFPILLLLLQRKFLRMKNGWKMVLVAKPNGGIQLFTQFTAMVGAGVLSLPYAMAYLGWYTINS
ncbi:hypothetical protein F0562_034004 [Nyssa sinensis]|uniref:Amino acid transporter transmembrane domain-containing protein n=1 Tax=Nyssa sinensis TaxID=561372 RepID=A0A5J5AID5_9ASTE|nr:hypothetical protein F0562_034004 [Nyssa sinensis]